MHLGIACLLCLSIDDAARVFPTPNGAFVLQTPDAATSIASRINDDLADKRGVIPPPTPGFVFSNRIVVKTTDAVALKAAVAGLGVGTPKRLAGLSDYWIVTCPSAGAALDALPVLAGDARFLARPDVQRRRALRSPDDPLFAQQWHLSNSANPLFDANLEPAWDLGHTGQGVTIGIVEAGWQTTHPDLAARFDADASQSGGVADPHATSCAGVAAASASNSIGGAGAAYEAGLSKLIFGSASKNAAAFLHRNDLNDVKSNSWGPPDNGWVSTWEPVERDAIAEGVASGRGGLGEIFVWAAGNGTPADRVDYDPFASSRFTIGVGAIDSDDDASWYNEVGSSVLVVAHSSGQAGNPGITTTTANSGYTSTFGGTSSASPLAAGVVALLLDANESLSWRDVQHVLVRSARTCDPSDPSWIANGAGREVSESYGFGAIDAHAAVLLARSWPPIGPEIHADTGTLGVNVPIPDDNPVGVTREVDIVDAISVESVEVTLTIDTDYVGDLAIALTSPSGTISTLATTRDDPGDDYVGYVFTTLRCWDEDARGTWTLTIADQSAGDLATWIDWRLSIHGSALCAPDCEDDGDLDLFDFLCFQDRFAAGNPWADFEHDGDLDVFDFLAFQGAYALGCP